MKKTNSIFVRNQVAKIVDEMYLDLVDKSVDKNILNVLCTAADHLKNNKNESAELIATKTVNGIILWTKSGKINLGNENAERIRELMCLSRSEGNLWYYNGVGNLNVQF